MIAANSPRFRITNGGCYRIEFQYVSVANRGCSQRRGSAGIHGKILGLRPRLKSGFLTAGRCYS